MPGSPTTSYLVVALDGAADPHQRTTCSTSSSAGRIVVYSRQAMMTALASVLFTLAGAGPPASPAPEPPAPASPAPEPPPATPPQSFTQEVRFDLGIASAVGLAGVTYSRSVAAGLLVELGIGGGVSGLQLSVMPKLVLGASTSRFVVGVGASVGIPGVEIVTDDGPFGSNENKRVITPWLNAEIGYDFRSTSGASFLVAGGITVALAHGCATGIDSCSELYGLVLPQIRVGYGHWF
ncbi:MAG TPA: hypothetical protein VF516_05090 [Kofleriaceae bacterium]